MTFEAGQRSDLRDVVVVGASAGGVQPLLSLAAGLPADLPAAVFVVLHMHPWSPSLLPQLFASRGPLPAAHAIHGEAIERGRIYLAPPDNHLQLRSQRVDVTRGPKENEHRPSVDALFRSAARAFGPRVIGVVLSGHLDCGTAGMLSIKARNGVAIVQDPAEAEAPSMPRSVLAHAQVDHVVRVRELPDRIVRLVHERPAPWPASLPPELLELEGERLGSPVQAVCPTCSGALTFSEMNDFRQLRCHVGHAFGPTAALAAQHAQLERSLWSALRALEETASMAERLAAGAAADERPRYQGQADAHRARAESLRAMLHQMRELAQPE